MDIEILNSQIEEIADLEDTRREFGDADLTESELELMSRVPDLD